MLIILCYCLLLYVTQSYELVEPTTMDTDGILHTLSTTLLEEMEGDGENDSEKIVSLIFFFNFSATI